MRPCVVLLPSAFNSCHVGAHCGFIPREMESPLYLAGTWRVTLPSMPLTWADRAVGLGRLEPAPTSGDPPDYQITVQLVQLSCFGINISQQQTHHLHYRIY
ncbi:hypothetical protein AGIG_G9288 [Arapaima gigas]